MFFNQPAAAIDDHGKRVPALRPRDVRDAAQGPDPRRAALARHLRNAISSESRRWTLRGSLVGLGLIAAWIGLLGFGVVSGLTRQPGVQRALIWGGLIAVGLLSRADTRRRVASQLAATAVAEGICGSCCYSLHDLIPQADGCLICPECGAAWQSRRITRPHWRTADALEGDHVRAATGWLVRFISLTPPSRQLLAPDDRGRFVPIVDSRLYLVPASRRKELGPDRIRQVRRALRGIRRIPRILLALCPLGMVGLCAYAGYGLLHGRDPGFAAVMFIPGAVFLVVGIGMLLSHAFYSPRIAARVMIAQFLCPSCAGSLTGLPLEPDGCAVCPECGSSWRPPTIAQ